MAPANALEALNDKPDGKEGGILGLRHYSPNVVTKENKQFRLGPGVFGSNQGSFAFGGKTKFFVFFLFPPLRLVFYKGKSVIIF